MYEQHSTIDLRFSPRVQRKRMTNESWFKWSFPGLAPVVETMPERMAARHQWLFLLLCLNSIILEKKTSNCTENWISLWKIQKYKFNGAYIHRFPRLLKMCGNLFDYVWLYLVIQRNHWKYFSSVLKHISISKRVLHKKDALYDKY